MPKKKSPAAGVAGRVSSSLREKKSPGTEAGGELARGKVG
jgi:hypothetical protein